MTRLRDTKQAFILWNLHYPACCCRSTPTLCTHLTSRITHTRGLKWSLIFFCFKPLLLNTVTMTASLHNYIIALYVYVYVFMYIYPITFCSMGAICKFCSHLSRETHTKILDSNDTKVQCCGISSVAFYSEGFGFDFRPLSRLLCLIMWYSSIFTAYTMILL